MDDKFNEMDSDIQSDALDIEDTDEMIKPATPKKPDDGGKTEIVGIRFKKNGKTYYFAPNGFTLNTDDRVIVDTSRGQEYGYTAVSNREIKNSEICEPLRSVVRMATADDTRIHEENVKKEIDAFNACIVLIDKHKLEMKLVDAELSFDRSKLLFYFSAEGRVDFRELVKDLAAMFHTRIEMRQIGIRDEAKILGGLGICGRPYCCNTFLSDFGQVSVKMAKEQNLSLNSAKISGSCGRLMCCLRYEYDTYLQEKALTPKVDSRVVTPNGAGVVVAANPLAGIIKVHLDGSADDAEAVMFVREDVVEESKYEGQTLTKTELPDKKHKESEITPIFDDTAPSTPVAEPVQVSTPTVAPTIEKNENKDQNQPENNHKKNRRHHHKKHTGSPDNNKPQAENTQQHNNQNQSGKPAQPKHQQNKNNNQPQPQKNNQPAQNQQKQNNQPNGDQSNQPAKKKKKFFKPYYKHAKNNKNAPSGDNK